MKLPPITPGPWSVDEDGEVTAEVGAVICNVFTVDDFPCVDDAEEAYERAERECPANARAIAQVPAMLETLRLCRNAVESVEPEALGMVTLPPRGEADFGSEYPLRSELLDQIDAVLRAAGVELAESTKYRTQLEANRTWSVYYGGGFRKGGFRLEVDAANWIRKTLQEELEATGTEPPPFGVGRMA